MTDHEFSILLALKDEMQSDLSENLKKALRFADDDREISNKVAVRFAAQFAKRLNGKLTAEGVTGGPTTLDVIQFVTEIYPSLEYHLNHTIEDAAAIQAYMLVIYGLDPLYLDFGDEDEDDDI
jgi:hypothetical protein